MFIFSAEYTGKDGKQYISSFDCPFVPWPYYDTAATYCWTIEVGLTGKYYVKGHRVIGITYHNGWCVEVDGNDWYHNSLIGVDIFEYNDLDKAIEVCEKANRMAKVKVRRNGI